MITPIIKNDYTDLKMIAPSRDDFQILLTHTNLGEHQTIGVINLKIGVII